jgi:hypothetical protein
MAAMAPILQNSWHATFFTNKFFFVKKVACYDYREKGQSIEEKKNNGCVCALKTSVLLLFMNEFFKNR